MTDIRYGDQVEILSTVQMQYVLTDMITHKKAVSLLLLQPSLSVKDVPIRILANTSDVSSVLTTKPVKKNNFNTIACIYDFLARLVFGGAIIDAQTHFLDEVPFGSRILIIGGGTGRILCELDKLKLSLEVMYVEASEAMLRKAKNHEPFQHLHVQWLEDTQQQAMKEGIFDIVITNFFLDVFDEESLPGVMALLSNQLSKNGSWLMSDFIPTHRLWQRELVKLMYRFFQLTTNLEGSRLIDFHPYFEQLGFVRRKEERCFHGMIASRVYSR